MTRDLQFSCPVNHADFSRESNRSQHMGLRMWRIREVQPLARGHTAKVEGPRWVGEGRSDVTEKPKAVRTWRGRPLALWGARRASGGRVAPCRGGGENPRKDFGGHSLSTSMD